MLEQQVKNLAEAERRQRILSDVTTVFLDYVGTDEIEPLRRVVEKVVAAFGDWCAFSLIDDEGILRQVVAYHPDPRQRELAVRARELVPERAWNAGPPEFNALVKGAPVVLEQITDEMLRAELPSEEAYELYREVGLSSVIVAPLRSGGEPLGIFMLASAGPGGRRYSQDDIEFVTAIATRASMAVRNARLARALAMKRDEAEHRAAELLAVLESAPGGIVLYGADDRLKYVSPGADRLLAAPVTPLIGRHYTEIIAWRAAERAGFEEMARVMERFAELFTDRSRTLSDDLELTGPDRRVLHRASVPVRSRQGTYVGRLVVFTDVTRERELDRLRSEFLTIAAHELRTPLTPLAMHLEIMRRRVGSGAGVELALVTRAEKQLRRLADLIDDLLNVSRLEAGQLEFQPERIDLDQLVSQVVADFRPAHPGHDFVSRGASQPLPVDVDPTRLEQVVVNLLQNATKYSPEGGRIIVEVKHDGTNARVSVTDEGIGIPSEELPHVFSRYFRARNAATSNFGGLGLGLFISNEIVARHGGSFEVTSEVNRGSTFTFTVPLAAAPVQDEPRRQRTRVLLVEDDPAILETISQVLEEEGFEVEQARNGQVALDRLRRSAPDVVLLDLMMPVLDGAAFVEQMRAGGLGRDLPLVVISADRDVERKGRQLGAAASLRKPLSITALLESVKRFEKPARP